jgi:transglutaminase-like putative cysteine protease
MQVSIAVSLSFRVADAADILLQVEAARLPEQAVDGRLDIGATAHFARVPGNDGIGERIWLRHRGALDLSYTAQASVSRIVRDIAQMAAVAPHRLPGEVVPWLMPSAHVPAGRFGCFVEAEFGQLTGGAKAAAMRDWIARHIRYERGSSHGGTSAVDTFLERRGVCRDFAHLMVALARAASIPARYVSVYAPDVEPPDFHAVAELFLDGPDGGEWQLVDATGMAQPGEMVKLGVGRDASDLPFLASFGAAVENLETTVRVERVRASAAQA